MDCELCDTAWTHIAEHHIKCPACVNGNTCIPESRLWRDFEDMVSGHKDGDHVRIS